MNAFTDKCVWKLRKLNNSFQELYIAPDLGGRLIQLCMDKHEYFFVNQRLLNYQPDQTRLGEGGSWLNFGGEKVWPAPQGWSSDNEWPGPPDPVLDSGIYAAQSGDTKNSIVLTSPIDKYTGLQIEKKVRLSEDRSEIFIEVGFHNKTKVDKVWSIWPVIQMNTSQEELNRYKVFCPIGTNSRFNDGYKVMHGLVNNPQYKLNGNNCFEVGYSYIVGKVGLDTDSGWAAFVDGKLGKVFVLKFESNIDKCFPENTSIQFWTSGRGYVYSRNKLTEHLDDRILNPAYLEMELLSPIQKIGPNESIHFEYAMLTSTIPSGEGVVSVNSESITSLPLQIVSEGDKLTITGKYGVFRKGYIKLYLKNKDGKIIEELHSAEVHPFIGIDISVIISEKLKETDLHVALELYDEFNSFIGEIDNIIIKEQNEQ